MHDRLSGLEDQYRDLQLRYRHAGGYLKSEVHADIEYIQSVRAEAEQILDILQGGTLFGRYSLDADENQRAANRWRRISVTSLIASAAAVASLSILTEISVTALSLCLVPAVGLFFFTSLESQNHRRREFDRRRIALRMAAIESYLQQRRSSESDDRDWSVLDDFIREHFIEPALDSNDVSYLGPRSGVFGLFHRRSS